MKQAIGSAIRLNMPNAATLALIQLADVRDTVSIVLGVVSIVSTLVMLLRFLAAHPLCDVCPFRPAKKSE